MQLDQHIMLHFHYTIAPSPKACMKYGIESALHEAVLVRLYKRDRFNQIELRRQFGHDF